MAISYLDVFPRESGIVEISEIVRMGSNGAVNPLFRFFNKVVFEGECWIWKASHNRSYKQDGKAKYGRFRLGSKRVYVHRYMYELCHGPIPMNMEVHHTCFNSLCVNPEHLEAATVEFNHGTHRPFDPDEMPF